MRRRKSPKLRTIARLSEMRSQASAEIFTDSRMNGLKRMLAGQRLILERENLPGSWAWRNPAISTTNSVEKGDSPPEE